MAAARGWKTEIAVREGTPRPGESREETIAKVQADRADIMRAKGSTMERDVNTRRRLGTRALVAGLAAAVAGAALGLLIGLVTWNPLTPVVLAIVGLVIGMLLTAERDDGTVSRRTRRRLARSGRLRDP
jgi:uncharacterized membrane protein